MIAIVIGLGNPGAEYATTRHNAGFWFVQNLANSFDASWLDKSKLYAEIASVQTSVGKLLLAKPQTFMNNSGKSVQAIMSYLKISLGQVIVAHDELDLSVGTIKLKIGGGHGGHNGLRDIIKHVGNDFIRLRVGIGHPGHKDKVLSYVLNKPPAKDKEMIDQSINKALRYIPEWQQQQWHKAMQLLH